MTLSEVRENIDKVDKQIKQLFRERMELADQVAQVKSETGDSILKPEREAAIISNLTKDIEPEIKCEYTALIKRIMEISRKYQYGRMLFLCDCLNITWKEEEADIQSAAVLETEQSFCETFSPNEVIQVTTIGEMERLIKEEQVDAGLGVLQDGSAAATDHIQGLLVREKLYINRCEVSDESVGRKKVVMFTKELVIQPDHNRIRIMFMCSDKSGSLASILSMIADYNVNLTEIQSCTNQEKDWNYEFYVEFEGNLLQKEMQALVFQLMNETKYFQLLGSYKLN